VLEDEVAQPQATTLPSFASLFLSSTSQKTYEIIRSQGAFQLIHLSHGRLPPESVYAIRFARMRLINISTLALHSFSGDTMPDYAILSHRWNEEEVSFQDLQNGKGKIMPGYSKIQRCCA
jgi:hypothetical protein